MKEHFYYLTKKDLGEESNKKITVCLILGDKNDGKFENHIFSRGVAICSEKDNFSKKIGRKIAQGRAWKACQKGNLRKIRRPEVKKELPNVFEYKSTVRPKLEQLILKEVMLLQKLVKESMEREVA